MSKSSLKLLNILFCRNNVRGSQGSAGLLRYPPYDRLDWATSKDARSDMKCLRSNSCGFPFCPSTPAYCWHFVSNYSFADFPPLYQLSLQSACPSPAAELQQRDVGPDSCWICMLLSHWLRRFSAVTHMDFSCLFLKPGTFCTVHPDSSRYCGITEALFL